MNEDDCGYLRARMDRETEMGRSAACADSASSHHEMARLYGERLESGNCVEGGGG